MQPFAELGNPLCTRCPLHQGAKSICVMGSGSSSAPIMIVGEAPGANEDSQGEPFVGKAGNILNAALGKAGLSREEVYVTNVVKCRPPSNRRPERQEIEQCLLYLVREYLSLKPQAILLLGNSALSVLTNKRGITANRGEIDPSACVIGDVSTFATYHPAAVMYSPHIKAMFEQDIGDFAGWAKSRYTLPQSNEALKGTRENTTE